MPAFYRLMMPIGGSGVRGYATTDRLSWRNGRNVAKMAPIDPSKSILFRINTAP